MFIFRILSVLCLMLAIGFAYYQMRPATDMVHSITESEADTKMLPKPPSTGRFEVETHLQKSHPANHKNLPNTSANMIYEKEHLNLNIDPNWDGELYGILQELDPENATQILKMFQQERINHSEKIQLNLKQEIAALSVLNGESGDEQIARAADDMDALEFQHQKRIKEILGVHYDHIQTQHDHHRDLGI
jgi:hypothetical protein